MKRNTYIVSFLLSLSALLFIFQNCGRPVSISSNGSSSRSLNDDSYDPDTTPHLDREGNDDPVDLNDKLVLYSSSKKAGTVQHESNWSLSKTSDGGYITAGLRDPAPGTAGTGNSLFQKFDDKGELVYSIEIGDEHQNQALRAIELPRTYLVIGTTLSLVDGDSENRQTDTMLYQLNKSDGRLIEAKRIGNNHFQQINDIIYVNSYSPYLLATGRTFSNSAQEHSGLILKLDLSLTTLWQKKFTLADQKIDFRSITRISGKGIYIVGSTRPVGANHGDSLIVRLNDGGYLLESRRITHPPSHDDFFSDIINTGSGLIIVGRMAGNGYNTDGSIMYFDYAMNFQKAFMVGDNSKPSYFTSGKRTRDGGLILSGKFLKTVNDKNNWYNWLIKLDKDHNIEFSRGFGVNYHNYQYYLHPLVVRNDSGYAFIANVSHSDDPVKMDPFLLLVNNHGQIPPACGMSAIELVAEVKPHNIENEAVVLNETNLTFDQNDIFTNEANFHEMNPGRKAYCSEEPYTLEL